MLLTLELKLLSLIFQLPFLINYFLGLILHGIEMIIAFFLALFRHKRIQISLAEIVPFKEFSGTALPHLEPK
jgi:hypothetical protein